MESSLLAVRAVTVVFVRQVLWPILALLLGVYGVLLALIGWIAATASAWWWLLAILPSLLLVALLAVWLLLYFLSGRFAPPMNRRRTAAARRIVSHIGEVAEEAGTPRILMLARVIKDVLWRPADGQTYIGSLAQHPGTLRQEFDTLRRLFE